MHLALTRSSYFAAHAESIGPHDLKSRVSRSPCSSTSYTSCASRCAMHFFSALPTLRLTMRLSPGWQMPFFFSALLPRRPYYRFSPYLHDHFCAEPIENKHVSRFPFMLPFAADFLLSRKRLGALGIGCTPASSSTSTTTPFRATCFACSRRTQDDEANAVRPTPFARAG